MFDYDDLWEPSPDDPKSECFVDEADGTRLVLVARHAIQGTELKVVVPIKAKFKHVKRALARRLGNPAEVLPKIQLVDKVDGLYTAYRDRDPVGDVKEVLVLGVELTVAEGSRMVAGLSDSEMTEDESRWVTVEYVGGRSQASRPEPRHETPDAKRDAGSTRRRKKPTSAKASQALSYLGGGSRVDAFGLPRSGIGGPRLGAAAAIQQAQPEQPVPELPQLSKTEAMNLQLELYHGFKDDDFQEELRLLEREAPHMSRTDFIKARQELFLLIQCQVLPRYGFEDSQEGVYKMMAAMKPFLDDPDFISLAEQVNEAVGINNKRERWDSLQKACEEWDFVDDAPRRRAK